MEKFYDRLQAGQILANNLLHYKNATQTIVLALPRGGVPVAYEIAHNLKLPLDVFLVRKLGIPGHEELALGAIASGGAVIFNDEILSQFNIEEKTINLIIEKEQQELNRRERVYRANKPLIDVKAKNIILVDDGIATGATIKVAIKVLKKMHPKKLIIAVPVSAKSTLDEIKPMVNEIVCPIVPDNFFAVGFWYEIFNQTKDQEVISLLEQQSNYLKNMQE